MKSAVIFEGYGYTVCWIARGEWLTVQRDYAKNPTGTRGVALKGQQAIEWRDGFAEAIDDDERADLARGIYKSVYP
jgi:hypothetical protein